MSGHWGTFFSDVKLAAGVWRRFPLLPVISLALFVASSGVRSGPGAFLFLPVALFSIGWVGTERMFYLRGFRDNGLSAREAFRFTSAFFWRFVWLGLAMGVPMALIFGVIAFALDEPFGTNQSISWAAVIANMAIFIAMDVLLTFVTPALTFTTPVVGRALKIGVGMLRTGWPGTAWYALVPPLAFVALTYLRPPEARIEPGWLALSAIATLLNLLAKGATAAFYLRDHQVEDDGAAFKVVSEELSQRKEPAGAGSLSS